MVACWRTYHVQNAADGTEVAVIGGGYIGEASYMCSLAADKCSASGTEVAAAMTNHGLKVTIVNRGTSILQGYALGSL